MSRLLEVLSAFELKTPLPFRFVGDESYPQYMASIRVEHKDGKELARELGQIADAITLMAEDNILSIYALNVVTRLNKYACDPMVPTHVSKAILSVPVFFDEHLYERMRKNSKAFLAEQSKTGVRDYDRIPLSTSSFRLMSLTQTNYRIFIESQCLVNLRNILHVFDLSLSMPAISALLKAHVERHLSRILISGKSAKKILAIYEKHRPGSTLETLISSIIPSLGTHKSYDSALARDMLSSGRSLVDFERSGLDIHDFYHFQLSGLQGKAVKPSGFSHFARLMILCAEHCSSIDRGHLENALLPHLHNGFSPQDGFPELLEKMISFSAPDDRLNLASRICRVALTGKRDTDLCNALCESENKQYAAHLIANLPLPDRGKFDLMRGLDLEDELHKMRALTRRVLSQEIGL